MTLFTYYIKFSLTQHNMTREEVKDKILKTIEEALKFPGRSLDDVCVACPKPGKNSWTYKEYRDATINDTTLEGSNDNPIDLWLKAEEYKEKQKQNAR